MACAAATVRVRLTLCRSAAQAGAGSVRAESGWQSAPQPARPGAALAAPRLSLGGPHRHALPVSKYTPWVIAHAPVGRMRQPRPLPPRYVLGALVCGQHTLSQSERKAARESGGRAPQRCPARRARAGRQRPCARRARPPRAAARPPASGARPRRPRAGAPRPTCRPRPRSPPTPARRRRRGAARGPPVASANITSPSGPAVPREPGARRGAGSTGLPPALLASSPATAGSNAGARMAPAGPRAAAAPPTPRCRALRASPRAAAAGPGRARGMRAHVKRP